MTASRVLPALLLLVACTRSTELLPRAIDAPVDRPRPADRFEPADLAFDLPLSTDTSRPHYPFCPTSLDVYGGLNFMLPGCGGPPDAPIDVTEGLLGSDNSGYDQTVAGRLATKLAGDPDVAQAFGSTPWTVRSCAGSGETLAQLVQPLPEDNCGYDSPDTDGRYLASCTANPAPVVLLAASMLDDRCHGGGPDSDEADDMATYQSHFQKRLHDFLGSRAPLVALVGNRTEWTNAPPNFAPGPPSPAVCEWQRPAWEEQALKSWDPGSIPGTEVRPVPDLTNEFKEHEHPCCNFLGLTCDIDWFFESRGWGAVNCDGAGQIVDLWYNALREWLLDSDFDCP